MEYVHIHTSQVKSCCWGIGMYILHHTYHIDEGGGIKYGGGGLCFLVWWWWYNTYVQK